MARKIQPCPECGSTKISIAPESGGAGTGSNMTSYRGVCFDCGFELDNLGGITDGRKDSAIGDWNRLVKKIKKEAEAEQREATKN